MFSQHSQDKFVNIFLPIIESVFTRFDLKIEISMNDSIQICLGLT